MRLVLSLIAAFSIYATVAQHHHHVEVDGKTDSLIFIQGTTATNIIVIRSPGIHFFEVLLARDNRVVETKIYTGDSAIVTYQRIPQTGDRLIVTPLRTIDDSIKKPNVFYFNNLYADELKQQVLVLDACSEKIKAPYK